MDPSDANQISDIAKIIGGGGLIAFAASVWYELRQQRSERARQNEQTNAILLAIKDGQAALREIISALLERDRMRASTPPQGVLATHLPRRDD